MKDSDPKPKTKGKPIILPEPTITSDDVNKAIEEADKEVRQYLEAEWR